MKNWEFAIIFLQVYKFSERQIREPFTTCYRHSSRNECLTSGANCTSSPKKCVWHPYIRDGRSCRT